MVNQSMTVRLLPRMRLQGRVRARIHLEACPGRRAGQKHAFPEVDSYIRAERVVLDNSAFLIFRPSRTQTHCALHLLVTCSVQ